MEDRYLRPKAGLLPKYVPEDEWLVMEDVHLGPFHIWVGMKGTVFVDLDGTVADIQHRRVYVASRPANWLAFERGIKDDDPVQWVIDAVNTLYDAGWTVICMSGRREATRQASEAWLEYYGVKYHKLYMRKNFRFNEDKTIKLTRKGKPEPDSRSDDIVKQELLAEARADGHDPDVVFDDRDQVVAMWRRLDIPCVQVAEGDF